MQIRFWGVRGSIAVPNRRMLRYGGNTSCVEVTLADGTEIILDAGTGIRELGEARTSQAKIVRVLLTHLHLDHIQGLLFFSPLFDPTNETLGYRITEGDATLCYLPDHEPALGARVAGAPPGWISGIGLAAGREAAS